MWKRFPYGRLLNPRDWGFRYPLIPGMGKGNLPQVFFYFGKH